MPFLDDNSRETARHYIPATEADTQAMLDAIGSGSLDELFSHIDSSVHLPAPINVPEEKGYDETMAHLQALSERNTIRPSFLGDGLPDYSVHEIAPYVASIRNLTTAYTPYQPERSQGTLLTHWIYQCAMTKLTGFEAINSSLYDRATAMFEAICTAIRLGKKADTALVAANVHPHDLEVLETLTADSEVSFQLFGVDPVTGRLDLNDLREKAKALGPRLAAVVFPQTNSLGLLEDVDALTDTTAELGVFSVAVIDPILLATGGLKAPIDFGATGANIIVGEGQHLAIGPNFGGPGLGVFGVRHNENVSKHVRATPGRYVGKASDAQGRECCVMVLSTREQHIRKEKATSNICSNQAYVATMAGASLLARGEDGLAAMVAKARGNAERFASQTAAILAYPETPFFNEVAVVVDNASDFLARGREAGILAGADVSDRDPQGRQVVKVSFSDKQDSAAVDRLLELTGRRAEAVSFALPADLLRQRPVGMPSFEPETIKAYYQKLGKLNLSPDDAPYPLGSCTMKYNPYLNDWAAGLPGFTDIHPAAPLEDAQGSLEVLHEIQEWFKGITGLPGVTTQPVAGAQGELVGVKMFQAYHRDRGESHRNIILIPRSAHGTNFATAAMAGMAARKVDDVPHGMVFLQESDDGMIDLDDLDKNLAKFGDRLCGVMITNPNTVGIFERHFAKVAEKVHAAGGLVYMDGANMNAIAGWLDLDKLGVDAVHNNLHKTWTIPHGGGGPGDAIVAVSSRLVDFLPGVQIVKKADGAFDIFKPAKSIGRFHRHWGNFAHKVRAYAYLLRLGREGVRRMSATSVLSARYLLQQLKERYPLLPATATEPRMHEFILTLDEEDFAKLEAAGISKNQAVVNVGKMFLDFGFHAPTVAWPEALGLMIEPTESYTKAELDRFAEAVLAIKDVIRQHPEKLASAPHFTPVDRIDEVRANRDLQLFEILDKLPPLNENRLDPGALAKMPISEIFDRVTNAELSVS